MSRSGRGLDRRFTRGGDSVAFDPLAGDASLLYLFDARFLVADGGDGSVESWTDRKAAVAASQGTPANKPTYTASDATWNNRPSISGDGTDDFLSGTLPAALVPPITTYFVCKLTTQGTRFLWTVGPASPIAFAEVSTAWRAQSGGLTFTAGTSDTNKHKFCMVVDGANSAIYRDGDFATALGTGTLGADSETALVLFALGAGTLGWLGSAVYLAIASGSHDATKRAQYAAYLDAQGWGLP